jgi:hypothetical protein
MKKKVFLFCSVSLLTLASLFAFAEEGQISGIDENENCTSTFPCENDPRGIAYSTYINPVTQVRTCCCAFVAGVRGCKKA